MEMVLTGDRITAQEAKQSGNNIVECQSAEKNVRFTFCNTEISQKEKTFQTVYIFEGCTCI